MTSHWTGLLVKGVYIVEILSYRRMHVSTLLRWCYEKNINGLDSTTYLYRNIEGDFVLIRCNVPGGYDE